MITALKYFLFPFSLIYGVIIFVRNKLYDNGILYSQHFDFPIITVGNLAVGGTGKTPMVEHLIRLLQSNFYVATLSRGYKRKTQGFLEVQTQSTSEQVGDEPLMYKLKYPNTLVNVGENRLLAIPEILITHPETQAIILDDAFQHRSVTAGLSILTTEYGNLFTRDFLLPTGSLRDVKASYKRADIIVVTKCPPTLSAEEKAQIISEIKPEKYQRVYFATIAYQTPYLLSNPAQKLDWNRCKKIALICGIANEKPLYEYVQSHVSDVLLKKYADHYHFDAGDIEDWHLMVKNESDRILITTEKDAVRLLTLQEKISTFNVEIFVLPIEMKFLDTDAQDFNFHIQHFIELHEAEKIAQEIENNGII